MDKEQLITKLSKATGLNPRRCQSFLERCGYDYDKTCLIPAIKSALNRPTIDDIFATDSSVLVVEEPPKKTKNKRKSQKKKEKVEIEDIFSTDTIENKENIKEPKKVSKDTKRNIREETPSKIVSNESKTIKGKVIKENKENPKKRKRKGKNDISSSKKPKNENRHPTKTRIHGGITFEVEVIGGKEYFQGKEIHSDQSGFYHPYPTMKDIMNWTKNFLKKTNSTRTITK